MMRLRLWFFSIAFVILSFGQAHARQLSFDDLKGLMLPTDAQISPDGRKILTTVVRYDFKSNSTPSSLLLIDVQTGNETVIAATENNIGSPRWSPDGTQIAFIASDPTGVAQIFGVDEVGAHLHEITHAARDVQQFAWKEDGRRIAFTSLVPAPPGWLAGYADAFEAADTSQNVRAGLVPAQLFVIAADGTEMRQLTFGKSSVVTLVGWHGDEVILGRTPDAADAHTWKTAVVAVSASSGRSRDLVEPSPHLIIAGYNASGSALAYTDGETDSPLSEQGLFATTAGGARRELTRELDRNIIWGVWLTNSRLLVSADDKTRVGLWTVDTQGRSQRVPMADVDFKLWGSISTRGNIALVGSTPTQFAQVYYLDSVKSSPRQITHFNEHLTSVKMGRTSPFSWRGPDGFAEYGVVTYPLDYSPGRKYPLIVLAVGGPGEAKTEGLSQFNLYGESFVLGWMRQMFAQHGYIVFEPNYRGCDNAGRKYLLATVNDLLVGPGKDIMAGVAALERHVSIDTTRVAITGHSEGGLFTAYLAAAYHVWKTGVAVDGDYDMSDEYNYGPGNGNQNGYNLYLIGSPWQGAAANFARNSPVTYASKVRTHLLLIGFVGDPGVPITEGYKERRALIDNHVPVTMVLFPVDAHVATDPVHREAFMRLWFDWLKGHL